MKRGRGIKRCRGGGSRARLTRTEKTSLEVVDEGEMCNDDDEYDVQADLGSKEIDSADETSEDECIKTKPSKF